jgi:hypothetical protein
MLHAPSCARQIVVHDLANLIVTERVQRLADVARNFAQKVRRQQSLECGQCAVLILARYAADMVEVDITPKHGRRASQLVRVGVQPRQAGANGGLNRFGQGCLSEPGRRAEPEVA